MNQVIAMLAGFAVLGLASHRLGKLTYVAMGLVILTYVSLTYILDVK